MLIGEEQHGIGRERLFDGQKVGRLKRRRQVDVADFGDEAGRAARMAPRGGPEFRLGDRYALTLTLSPLGREKIEGG
jgi:hypothetical protein